MKPSAHRPRTLSRHERSGARHCNRSTPIGEDFQTVQAVLREGHEDKTCAEVNQCYPIDGVSKMCGTLGFSTASLGATPPLGGLPGWHMPTMAFRNLHQFVYMGKEMELFKVAVAVNGRNVEVLLKAGILATVEFGSHENKIEIPKNKVSVLVGKSRQGLVAWVQVGSFDSGKTLMISHEGWVPEGDGTLKALSSGTTSFASLARILHPTAEMLKCQHEADFGALACCTSYGNGCYVRCCNSCCSDPVGCPGASCCG